jgi:acetyl-CoA carboxylase biotin carboxyl carrier protein
MTAELDDDYAVRLSADQIAQLAELLKGDGLRTLQFDTAKGRFAVTLGDPASAPIAEASHAETVCAASVGEFLTGYPSRGEPLARVGATVAPGAMLGLVRTGLVFAPVTLATDDPRPATLTRILVSTGTLVGYGTPLFEIERH